MSTELCAGEAILLDGRWLRVSRMPDGTVCRDHQKRVAVRNCQTHRLSYIPEWLLLEARRVTAAQIDPLTVPHRRDRTMTEHGGSREEQLAEALRGAIRELEAGGYCHDHPVLAPWKRLVAQAPAPADTVTRVRELEQELAVAISALDAWAPRDGGDTTSLATRIEQEGADFQMLCEHLTAIYMHATDGRISKPNTEPSVVIAVSDDLETERTDAAINEAIAYLQAADTVTVKREDLERALELAHEVGGDVGLGADEMREARRLAGLED